MTSATSTSTVNSDEFTIPASRPTFSAISCIRPRAFIRIPTRSATGPGSPRRRAAPQHAPNFPAMASATHAAPNSSTRGSPNSPNSVRSPENVKNSGRKTADETGPTRSITRSVRSCRGITTPSANAPNTA